MNVQKIIITILVVLLTALLGVGAFSLWLIRSSSASPTQEQPLTQGGNTADSTSGNTTSPSVTTPASFDLKKTYDTFFASLGATRVSYTLVGSEQGLYGDVYKLYAEDVAASKKMAPNAAGYTLEVGTADLDKDGTPEVIVYENLPGLCGSGGCPIDVYKKHETLYENIFSGLGSEIVGVSSQKTEGYADLLVSVHGDTGFMSNVTSYVWNGSAYQQAAVVATWDGAAFSQPLQ